MWKPKVVKMSNMKCPFCNKPLQPTLRLSDEYWCENYDCPRTNIKWTGSQKLWQELIRTRKALDIAKKENEDKKAVLNCIVDMLKTLNQKYTLIMGKDVIKETVRLLEQTKGGDNE